MSWQIMNPKKGTKKPQGVTVRIGLAGVFSLNAGAKNLLKVKTGDRVMILWNSDEKAFYITKSPNSSGYILRKGSGTSGTMTFNNVALVRDMTEKIDLPLGDEKLKSVKLDISENPTKWNEFDVYKIS